MSDQPIPSFPIGPEVTRIFVGYKLPSMDRDKFYTELGDVFMPGTPYMQASLGLNAYLPAVLDPEPDSGLPDEVALIVYSSRERYDMHRRTSLRRRIYTHAHAAVFDMGAPGGGGQFPGPVGGPTARDDRKHWYLWDRTVDWQGGVARLAYFVAEDGSGDVEGLRIHTENLASDPALEAANQLLCVATPAYAAIWLHSDEPLSLDPALLAPDAYELQRDLTAQPVRMHGLQLQTRLEFREPSMFNFRFTRDIDEHL